MKLHKRPTIIQACALAVAIAAPVALIAATWEPLEPPPRAARTSVNDHASGAGTAVANPQLEAGDGQSRDRKDKKEPVATYAIPTSVSAPSS